MRRILANVRDGTFAKALRDDHARGFPWFNEQRKIWREHDLEPTGAVVRSLMPWLADRDDAAS